MSFGKVLAFAGYVAVQIAGAPAAIASPSAGTPR